MEGDLLNKKAFLKKMIFIGFPMVLQSAISNLLNFIDNIMVGGLGTVAIEAVSIYSKSNIFCVHMCFMWDYLWSGSIRNSILWKKRL